MLVFFFAEVHPFGSVTAEPIAVDIVSPEEVAEAPKPPETPPAPETPPKPDIQIPLITDHPTEAKSASAAKSAASAPPPPAPPPAAAPQAAARQQKQAALQPSHPAQQQAAAPPPPQPQPPQSQAQPQPEPQSASIAPLPPAIPQEPDISVKYHVLLGLPQVRPGDGFDAAASAKADVAANLVSEFRRHLRTCSKLPESIVASDKIKIMLRVFMAPDGKLAAEPALIEASASAKGPALMQSAIGALQACQPYTMLPSDRYGEWKVLDLSFSPKDFSGG